VWFRSVLVVIIATVATAGCTPTPEAPDGAVDVGSGDGAVPSGPQLTPCPDGWREVTEDVLTRCDPWPEGGQLDCPIGAAHFPGEPGCRSVGSPCPEGEFPDIVEEVGRTYLYVRVGGSPTGTGTREDPRGSLPGLGLGTDGPTTYVLSKGEHLIPFGVSFPGGNVTIQGACSRDTFLVADSLGSDLLVASTGETVLRDLTIGPARTFAMNGVSVRPGAELLLDGIAFGTGISVGVFVDAGRVEATDVCARDLVVLIRGDGASEILVRRAVLTGTGALSTAGIVDATFEDTAMNGTLFGVFGFSAGSLVVRRTSIVQSHFAGIFLGNSTATEPPPQMLAEDVVIADTLPAVEGTSVAEQSDGRATVVENAELTLRRAYITGSRELGIYAAENGVVDGEDIAIRRTTSGCDACVARGGTGIGAYLGGAVSLRRFLIDDADLCGVHIGPEGSVDLQFGTVARSRIGACIPEGYDADRVSADVHFVDNEQNLGSETLPVPEPLMQPAM